MKLGPKGKTLKSFVVTGLAILTSASIAEAQYQGAVTAGTGGAGRAAIEAGDSPFLNPASLPHLKGYYFTTATGGFKKEDQTTGQFFTASITDNLRETIVPTSLAYGQTQLNYVDGSEEELKQIRLEFGGFWKPGWSSGFGVIYENDRVGDKKYTQTNMNFGVQWTPNKNIGFAAVVDNLLENSQAIPEKYRLMPSTGVGMAYNFRKVSRLKLDLVTAPNNNYGYPVISGGVENYLNRWVIFRAGAQKDNFARNSTYSAGIGFVLPKFGLQYAYQDIQGEESGIRHAIDMAIPVW